MKNTLINLLLICALLAVLVGCGRLETDDISGITNNTTSDNHQAQNQITKPEFQVSSEYQAILKEQLSPCWAKVNNIVIWGRFYEKDRTANRELVRWCDEAYELLENTYDELVKIESPKEDYQNYEAYKLNVMRAIGDSMQHVDALREKGKVVDQDVAELLDLLQKDCEALSIYSGVAPNK